MQIERHTDQDHNPTTKMLVVNHLSFVAVVLPMPIAVQTQ